MATLKSLIKTVIKPIIKLCTFISFKLFFSQHLRNKCRNSTLVKWNEGGRKISCPYCGKKQAKNFYRTNSIDGSYGMSDKAYGLFEKNKDSLSLYYGTWMPEFIWNSLGCTFRSSYLNCSNKGLNELKDRFYIDYLRCQDCDLIFQNYPHQEESINEYYKKYYRRRSGKAFGRADSPDAHHVRWKELLCSHFLKITSLSSASKILDVGCAEGCFCLAMNKFGMEPYGIEPAEQMVVYANRTLNLKNIKCATYNKHSYQPGSFDGIHCFHVLEHILDINSTLESMHLHLKPKGILSLSVPCIDLVKNEEDFNRILCAGHIYSFSEKWFQSNLLKYGFEIFKILKSSFDIKKYGINNPGRAFSVVPWGDVPGGIYIFAKKIKR